MLPLLLHKLYVSSSEDRSLVQTEDVHQELTEHMKDGLYYHHSAVSIFTLPEHKASAAPGAASSINSAVKCHPFWHHGLGKPLRDSRSATSSHLKAVTQKTLAGQILFHRNLQLSLRTLGSHWTVLKSKHLVFSQCASKHKPIYIISSALIQLCSQQAPIASCASLLSTCPCSSSTNSTQNSLSVISAVPTERMQTAHTSTGGAENLPGYWSGCNWLPHTTHDKHNSSHRISSEPLYSSASATSFKFSCLPAITHLKARNCPSMSLATGIGKTTKGPFLYTITWG